MKLNVKLESKKIQIFLIILILLFLSAVIYFYISIKKERKLQQLSNCTNYGYLKYDEKITNVCIYDRYKNKFDLNDYKGKPILIIFMMNNNKSLIEYYQRLRPKIIKNIEKGLYVVLIAIEFKEYSRPDTLDKYQNTKVFFENDRVDFTKTFKFSVCCGSDILLDDEHRIKLTSKVHLDENKLSEIVNNKCQKIFK